MSFPQRIAHFACCSSAVQYDGSYIKTHPGASGYNEVVISALYWDRSLPWSIEAFVFATQAGDDAGLVDMKRKMIQIHRSFLEYYGLSAAHVPLLRYHCSQQDPHDDFLRPLAKPGTCFEVIA